MVSVFLQCMSFKEAATAKNKTLKVSVLRTSVKELLTQTFDLRLPLSFHSFLSSSALISPATLSLPAPPHITHPAFLLSLTQSCYVMQSTAAQSPVGTQVTRPLHQQLIQSRFSSSQSGGSFFKTLSTVQKKNYSVSSG